MGRRDQINKYLALLGFLVIVLQTQQLEAHTRLTQSFPSDSTVLVEDPGEVVLTFSTDVRLTAISLLGPGGELKKLGPVPEKMNQKIFLAIQEKLAPGDYLLTWRAVGADTHLVSGEIHFSVLGPSSSPSVRVFPEP